MTSSATPGTADREIVISRVFSAPRELVFDAWTDAERIGRWFGPTGFTTTTHEMSVKPGGLWRYIMHGPDGTDYHNWIRYHEVVRPERLVYDHGSTSDSPAHFHVTVTFTERGGKTELTMRSIFPTAEARDAVVRRYGAVAGGKQTLARLAEQIERPAPPAPTAQRNFRFSRAFAAPRDLVFRAWTEPQHLAKWWGPHGFTNPRCDFAARPGGAIHIDMRGPDGVVYPMTGTVEEITVPDRLVFSSAALDDQGRPAMRVRNIVTFTEADGITTVTIDAHASDVTPLGSMYLSGMSEGWGQSLQRLDETIELQHIGTAAPELEIVSVRLIHAAPAAVWRAWTDARRLAAWWGPKDFRNTFERFEPRPGGEWRFVMHGPNGTDYPNYSRYVELAPQRRIVFDHVSPPEFRVVASFSERAGETHLTFRMRFADAKLCANLRGLCVPSNEENFDRLEMILATMP